MNTLHFKYAVEVERIGSITQAADNLYMAQPNLSKAIKELEDNLGIAIFKRTSKGVIPTQKGTEFLEYAKNVLNQIEKMESLSIPEKTERQCLNISIPQGGFLASSLIKFISELDMDKEIDINIKETNAMQAMNNILFDKFDIGIIRYQTIYENYYLDYLADKEFTTESLWEYEYLAVMSKNHPLAAMDNLSSEDFIDSIEILQGDPSMPPMTSGEMKKSDDSLHIKRKILVQEQYSQLEMLSQLPNAFMWASPIPEELLDRYDLVQKRCHCTHQLYKDLLIYPKDYKFTLLDKKLIDRLYEEFKTKDCIYA
jgi:hypothetical protein